MLNEIFIDRYSNSIIWNDISEIELKLLSRSFRIVEEQLYPFYVNGKVAPKAADTWKQLHDSLAMELGIEELGTRAYWYPANKGTGGKPTSGIVPMNTICKNYVCAKYDDVVTPDIFMKQRLSFIELAFRKKGIETAKNRLAYENEHRLRKAAQDIVGSVSGQKSLRPAGFSVYIGEMNTWIKFQECVDELNVRFRQAKTHLNYHSGYIQVSEDELVEKHIETPFWKILTSPEFRNVDIDIKEAIDRRDTDGRDPAFYAARALESAIKIVSDKNGWTTGHEKGAANYVDNLQSKKNGRYISEWEAVAIKEFFRKIRNPLGHGPGSNEMPTLSVQQTNWAIETCMSWIKSILQR